MASNDDREKRSIVLEAPIIRTAVSTHGNTCNATMLNYYQPVRRIKDNEGVRM